MKTFIWKEKLMIVVTSLFLAAGIIAPPLNHIQAASKNPPSQKAKTKEIDPEYDIATGWQISEFKSDMPNVKVEDLFIQNRQSEDSNSNLNLNAVFTNFANVKNAKLKATRKFHLKRNRIYKMNWYYGLKTTSYRGISATASIDFNGNKLTSSNGYRDVYTDTIVTGDEEEEYAVTIEFNAPSRTSIYAMIGYDLNNPNSGVVEESMPVPTVDTPEAGESTVKGKGVSGNQIIVFDDKNLAIGTGAVEPDGTFLIGINRKLAYNERLRVIQTNKEGSQSDPVYVIVNDTIVPIKPTIDHPVEFTDQLIKGTTESNVRVEVRNSDDKLIGAGVANEVIGDNIAKFNFKLSEEIPVDTRLFVTAVDEAGNRSETVETSVVDNSKPHAPTVNEITDQDQVLTGKGTKAGNKIIAMVNKQKFEADVKEDKTFQIDLKRTFPGGTSVDVKEVDKKGNVSESTQTVIKGTIKTTIPKVNEVGDQDKIITGTSEPNASIQAVIGGATYEGQADARGHFSIELNQAYAKGTEGFVVANGSSGIPSDGVPFVVIDRTAPDKPVLNSVKDTDTKIVGKTEPNARVRIDLTGINGKNDAYESISDENGNFTIQLDSAYAAKTIITATATDDAGNKSQATQSRILSSINLEMVLDEITNQDDRVTGSTSRPNTYYQVKIGNRVYEGYSDQNGVVSIDLDRQYPVATNVAYAARDGEEQMTTQNTFVFPHPPAEFSLGVGDKELNSGADPFAKVTVTVNGKSEQTVIADENGKFRVKFSEPLAWGDIVTIKQEVEGLSSGETMLLIV